MVFIVLPKGVNLLIVSNVKIFVLFLPPPYSLPVVKATKRNGGRGLGSFSVFSPTKRQGLRGERRVKFPRTLIPLSWLPPFTGQYNPGIR